MTRYAVLRLERIKDWGDLRARLAHNRRETRPEHADPDRHHLNGSNSKALMARAKSAAEACDIYRAWLDDQLAPDPKTGKVKLRRGGIIAFEVVASASGLGLDRTEPEAARFVGNTVSWLKSEFRGARLLSADWHGDEQTGHLHAILAPLDDSPRRRGPAGVRLNMRKYAHTKTDYRRLQTTFAEAVGFERGRPRQVTMAEHEDSKAWRARQVAEAKEAQAKAAAEAAAQAERAAEMERRLARAAELERAAKAKAKELEEERRDLAFERSEIELERSRLARLGEQLTQLARFFCDRVYGKQTGQAREIAAQLAQAVGLRPRPPRAEFARERAR